jgi:hypothetical protein
MQSSNSSFVDHLVELVPSLSLSAPPSTSDGSGTDSPLGSFLRDPSAWLAQAAGWAWHMVHAWWPLLVVVVVAALAVRGLLAVLVRRAQAGAAARASWVEITPPAVLPVEGARGLWRALAGLLSRTRRYGLTPRRLAVEFVADSAGMRVGVWVPAALSARSVAETVGRCWPGARATVTSTPPTVTNEGGGRVTAVHAVPCSGMWSPLLNPTRTPRRQFGGHVAEVDGLHSVLSALAERGYGERACAQLVVSPARIARSGGGDRSWWVRIGLAILKAPFVIVLAVVDVLLSKGATTSHIPAQSSRPEENPAVIAHRKAVAAKQAHGPHLHATLRLAIASPLSQGLRRHAVNTMVIGYDQATSEASLVTRPMHRSARRLWQRLPGGRRDRFVITLDEAAALWHLPDHPAQYGITDAPARVSRPRRDLPRLHGRQPGLQEGGHDAAA